MTDEQIQKMAEQYANNVHEHPALVTFRKYTVIDYIAGFKACQSMDRWISVDEYKTISGNRVFALIPSLGGKWIKCIAVYTDGWDLEVDADGDESHFNHSEDKSFMPKGWYEECEQEGGSYDSVYFKRDVKYILDCELPEHPALPTSPGIEP